MPRSKLKVILIGESGVGKTALRTRFMGKGFKSSYLMTIGADFSIKRERNNLLQIWDLAGQDAFREVRRNYYYMTDGALLVFDVMSKSTFYDIEKWLDELLQNHGRMVPTIILANKSDLFEFGEAEVTEQEISELTTKFQQKHNFEFPVIYTSALTGLNVESAFSMLINEINSIKIGEEI